MDHLDPNVSLFAVASGVRQSRSQSAYERWYADLSVNESLQKLFSLLTSRLRVKTDLKNALAVTVSTSSNSKESQDLRILKFWLPT